MKCLYRIGNQTSVSAPLMAPFDYALSQGFTAFEWFPDGWGVENIDQRARQYIRDNALKFDLSLSVHMPWTANPLKEPFGVFRDNISFASDIGARLINIHFYNEEGITPYLEAITPIIGLAGKAGLILAIENTAYTGPEDFNRLFDTINSMEGTDHVGLCLDIGHANLCSATRNDYLRFIDLIGPHVSLIHLHLHENYGDADTHLPLFTGPSAADPSGIRGVLKRAIERGFAGSIIFEQWPNPPSLLDTAAERICLMLEELRTEEIKEEAEDFLSALGEADRKSRSWREKLLWVRDALAAGPAPEKLIAIAAYLRFIGTGELPCQEDSHHYRPSHHARVAEEIHEILAGISDPALSLITRKIYPWLPSYNESFKRAEPLTRIRDIAHRNDIPQELKREIKHTLQNKLHRCAGPEDLQTSGAILAKITAEGASYSPAFVEEFRIFHEELKEFFNASGLEERLSALLGSGIMSDKGADLIGSFLALKRRPDPSIAERIITLSAIAELRRFILAELPGMKGAQKQQLRLTDIGLEDYAFVSVGAILDHLAEVRQEKDWEPFLELLFLIV
ncbi:MAG: sugar phosphate isomerase/epimerase, partial [Nitrospirales bacterium]|nr:sugar phosphate isomerase/epimerase [Nitrospirales bacterium]